jgi:hypothetical protein
MKSNDNRFEDQLFPEAAKLWNLEKLYVDLAQQKPIGTGRKTKLTPVEKAILRGLLCSYPPKKIAAALQWALGTLCVELTKGLYRYVEALTNQESNTLKNWRDISNWLEAAGYKTPQHRHDWGDAPDKSVFYGRTDELDTLKQWIGKQHYRLVAILGMGGIGKTTLAAKLAQEIQDEFDCVIWRSLRYCPPVNQLLVDLIQFLSNQQQCNLQEDTKVLISRLIECLRQHRCLVVLDDAQMLMRSCTHAGQYREGYEGYTELLTEVGRERHQSCLVVNSWEKPIQMELLEQETSYVGSLKLKGLPPEEARKLLAANSLSGEEEEFEKLINLYRGNPLALNTVITTIKDFFNYSVSEFLTWNTVIVAEPLQAKLIEQLNRLDDSEIEIVNYLAKTRIPVLREQLRNNIHLGSDSKLINALNSLERRSIIEKITERSQTFFTIPPVVMNVTQENYNIELSCYTSNFLSTSLRYLMANRLGAG